MSPHGGGELVDLYADAGRSAELREASRDIPSWDLTDRQLCDLELLMSGGFSPLRGFLGSEDAEAVWDTMRLADGTLWPIPVTLDVTEALASTLSAGERLALRDPEGVMLAALNVTEVWEADREREAASVFGTTDPRHPGVAHALHRANPVHVAGVVEGISAPAHYDFNALRLGPAALRAEFARRGWNRVVGFQTRNPMHRAHVELTLRAARDHSAKLLIHPVVGVTRPGDVDHYTRVRAYRAILGRYPPDSATLALLPLAMRMAGPREALWHSIIRRNFGCTHFIVGRDHAGPGAPEDGKAFYDPYEAQELLERHRYEVGVEVVPFRQFVYLAEHDIYVPEDEVPHGATVMQMSGTELRERLGSGGEIPEWYSYPEAVEELRRTHRARNLQGFTVFFTGLSGSGKSTVAKALMARLLEIGGRPVTLLDGDIVRKHLSSELGFSKEHRDINVRRIGFVASEITKNGGVALCAPIAPYSHTRQEVREMVESGGGFILVHVSTPLEVCEQRDRKGLYAKARAGLIESFTGVSDPYEVPGDADLDLDTSDMSPTEAVGAIVEHLQLEGYLPS